VSQFPSSPEFPAAATTRLPPATARRIAASIERFCSAPPRLMLITDRPDVTPAMMPAAISLAGSSVPSPSDAS
jgi:ABC-type ATPase with predicted acetyltransferase domain